MRRKRRSPARRPPACLGGAREPARTPRSLACIATLVAAVFLFAAPAAQAARSEFFGITDDPRSTTRTSRDRLDRGARVPPPAQVELRRGEPGLLRLGARPTMGRGSRLARDQDGPVRVGSPSWAGTGGVLRLPVQPDRAICVAGLPEGGGGPLRAGRQLLGERLPSAVRARGDAPADPLLADLERAQPEVLVCRGTVKQKAQRYARLLQDSHDAIKSKDPQAESCSPEWPPRPGAAPYGSIFLDSSTRRPGSRPTSTRPPCTPTHPSSTRFASRSSISAR